MSNLTEVGKSNANLGYICICATFILVIVISPWPDTDETENMHNVKSKIVPRTKYDFSRVDKLFK